jgi:hypothetical protein
MALGSTQPLTEMSTRAALSGFDLLISGIQSLPSKLEMPSSLESYTKVTELHRLSAGNRIALL